MSERRATGGRRGGQSSDGNAGRWRRISGRLRLVVLIVVVVCATVVGAVATLLAGGISIGARQAAVGLLAVSGVSLVVLAMYCVVDDRWVEPVQSLPRWAETAVVGGCVVVTVADAALSTAFTSPGVTVPVGTLWVVAAVPMGHALGRRAVRQHRGPSAVVRCATAGLVAVCLVAGVFSADLAGAAVPNAVPGVVFLATWTVVYALGRRSGDRQRESIPPLVRIRQAARLEPWPVAVHGALPVGGVGGALALSADAGLFVGSVVALLSWAVAVCLVLWWLVRQRTRTTGEGLVVVDTAEDDLAHRLTVENAKARAVDLSDARVQDADGDHYYLDGDASVPVSGRRTVVVPEQFVLATGDTSVRLPFGYTLGHDRTVPVVYDRRGDGYALRRQDTDRHRPAPPPVRRG